MAEIKSAIELAMERTRNLVMSREEREASARQELEGRLKALLRRYLEGMSSLDAFHGEIAKIEADEISKKSLLFDLIIDEYDFGSNDERVLPLLEMLDAGPQKPLTSQLGTLRRGFREEMKKREIIVREDVRNSLREMGITGDGAEPNLEAWNEWRQAREEVVKLFRQRLRDLKTGRQ
jgi:hypothetical protein